MKDRKKPTEAELGILRVLWARGPSTVREVAEQMGREGAYTTVLKLLQIMTDKGLVVRDERVRTHVYEAAFSESHTQKQLVTDLLDRVFDGLGRQAGAAGALDGQGHARRTRRNPEAARQTPGRPQMNAAIHVAGWTLVHFAWQGALVGLAAAFALRLLRHSGAAVAVRGRLPGARAMFVLPGATAWRTAAGRGRRAASGDGGAAPDLPPHRAGASAWAQPNDHRHPPARAGPAGQATTTKPSMGPLLLPILVAFWFTGVCVLLARLAGGWWRVHRMVRAARALPVSAWHAVSQRLAGQLGLHRMVKVVDATFVDSPVVVGWLQPVILLPVAALAGLTPEQVRAILAHELAHVRRHDAVVNVAQTVAETLLFYHPAVWWLSSRIRTEREHCCDDVALSVSGDAYAYASALAELESWRADRPRFALAATGGPLLRGWRGCSRRRRHGRRAEARCSRWHSRSCSWLAPARCSCSSRGSPDPRTRHASPRPAWRMVFDHPSGQMAIRGFTARDLVRYAYQLPTSRVIGGPAWLDAESFDLVTTVDHVPAADETPAIVRQLLEDRFALRVHEATTEVPVFALEMARPDGSLGPNLQPATAECFDQKGWVAAGAPVRGPLPQGQRTVICGEWNGGVSHDRVLGITMDEFAARLLHNLAPGAPDVINRTGLEGPYDVSLEYFKPAAMVMGLKPSVAPALRVAGFQSVGDALESQLGLKLVPTTTQVPAIAIDEIQRPLPGPPRP
jgi:uncharacterized protein (TIGR03435 family)